MFRSISFARHKINEAVFGSKMSLKNILLVSLFVVCSYAQSKVSDPVVANGLGLCVESVKAWSREIVLFFL